MQLLATPTPAGLHFTLQALPCAHQLSSPDLGARMQSALQSILEQDGIDKVMHMEADAVVTIIHILCQSRWLACFETRSEHQSAHSFHRCSTEQQHMLSSHAEHALQAVVIGTDIPDITAEVIDKAVAALEQYEVRFHTCKSILTSLHDCCVCQLLQASDRVIRSSLSSQRDR